MTSRRQFLHATEVAALSTSTVVPARAAQGQRVVVIGAGLAGLAAAHALQAAGHQVQILEGRERIGGRVHTSLRWSDWPLDLGATWIHGVRGNPLTVLADQLQARRIGTRYERSRAWDNRGRMLDEETQQRLEQLGRQFQGRIKRAQHESKDRSVRSVADELVAQTGPSAQNQQLVNFIVSSTVEQEYGGSAEELSAHWYDAADEFLGGDVLFAEGFHVITRHLAKGLEVHTGQPVREVRWGHTAVQVLTTDTSYHADRVVVTLPLGVLKAATVRFAPPLPAEKREAVAALGMGVLNKCYLRFPRVFWPRDVDWMEQVPLQHGHWTEWVNFARATGAPVLLGFNAAARGREIEALSDAQTVDEAMQALRTIFGANIPGPVDHQLTRWNSDPFARGAYSFNALGSTPQMRLALARPLGGRLFFAGEATHVKHFGTAHGALASGRRAANEVLQASR